MSICCHGTQIYLFEFFICLKKFSAYLHHIFVILNVKCKLILPYFDIYIIYLWLLISHIWSFFHKSALSYSYGTICTINCRCKLFVFFYGLYFLFNCKYVKNALLWISSVLVPGSSSFGSSNTHKSTNIVCVLCFVCLFYHVYIII